ncbi:hypothetical protein BU15DRAFT_64361 [Melanogaster broomeanus]|nr:hypothetical protein BU15DRAFT_64361 [Melanogaster broomeanus]
MLLRVPAEELGEALTHKMSYIHKELFTVLLNVKQSVGQRDQLVQNFHVILFAFVVEMANYKLAPIGETPTQIVLLDQASFQTKGDKLWELNCESEEGGYSGHVNRSSEYADGAFWIAIVGVWDIQMVDLEYPHSIFRDTHKWFLYTQGGSLEYLVDIWQVLGYRREKFGMPSGGLGCLHCSLAIPIAGLGVSKGEVWDVQTHWDTHSRSWDIQEEVWDIQTVEFGMPSGGHGISKGEVWDIQTVEFGMPSGGLGCPHCSIGTPIAGHGISKGEVWDIQTVESGMPSGGLGCSHCSIGTPIAGHGISKGEVWDIQTVEFGMPSGGLGYPQQVMGYPRERFGISRLWSLGCPVEVWDAHIVALGHPQ